MVTAPTKPLEPETLPPDEPPPTQPKPDRDEPLKRPAAPPEA